jgi:hypothetical protein
VAAAGRGGVALGAAVTAPAPPVPAGAPAAAPAGGAEHPFRPLVWGANGPSLDDLSGPAVPSAQ